MKKLFLLLSLTCIFFTNAKSQCAANFSFAVNSNGNVSFTNLSSGVSTFAAYSWDFGDGQNVYNTASPSHIYGGNGTYSVTLLVNDSTNNCNTSITHTLALTNVTCNVNASMSINISNAYVTFSNTSTGTIPGTTYSLSYGNGYGTNFSAGSFNAIGYAYSISGNYLITLTAINSTLNCYSTYTTMINVTVPLCNLNANFSYTINNSTVSFSNLTTGASSLASYFWYFGGSSFYGQNPPPQTFQNGQYVVTLTVQDSVLSQCSSISSQTINITGLPCIVNTSFVMVKDSSVTSSIVWDAYPSYPSNVSAVNWNWGDGSNSNGLFPTHTYSATGMYNICMSVTISCGSDTTICLNSNINRMNGEDSQMATVNVLGEVPTGINKIEENVTLTIYPNPVKDQLTIENNHTGASIVITDLLGKIVFTSENQKENKFIVDLSGLSPGIYIIKATGTNYNATTKLIKE